MEIKLNINKIIVSTVIGIRDCEQDKTQDLSIDLEIIQDFYPKKDALIGLVDYSMLSRKIKENIEKESFMLIETVAIKVAHILDNESLIKRYKVRVTKKDCFSIEIDSHR